MKYYKDDKNQVFAFESDGSQDEFIPANLVPITEAEADELRNPPALTQEEQFEAVRVALQSAIDAKAKSFNFSNGNAMMLYAGFNNPFQPLAQTFATWEASVWVDAETYRQQVIAGTKPMLSPSEAVALMPVYPS